MPCLSDGRACPDQLCAAGACVLPAGSLFFYVFRGQTSAAAFNSDLAYGGATYAATGRGYKLRVRQGFGFAPS